MSTPPAISWRTTRLRRRRSSAFIFRCTRRRGWRRHSSPGHGASTRARDCAHTGSTRRSTRNGCASRAIDDVLGPEAEEGLVDLAKAQGSRPKAHSSINAQLPSANSQPIARLAFIRPDREGLPPLHRYADTADARRIAPRGGQHRHDEGVQASLPALSDSPGLRGTVSRRAGRRRHRGHPGAGGGRRAAHFVRRPGLPERSRARTAGARSRRRRRSRASPTTSRSRWSICSRSATCSRCFATLGVSSSPARWSRSMTRSSTSCRRGTRGRTSSTWPRSAAPLA